MKKLTTYSLWLLAPIALWGQSESAGNAEIDLNEVTVAENGGAGMSMDASIGEVVEIPDATINGVQKDESSAQIPSRVEALPTDTEIVLELPGQAASAPGEAVLSSSETISVDFPDEDVRTILRNIADLFELNLVIPDTLQGRTSIKLRNITWGQAFEVVLRPLGFTYVEDRNIILIKNVSELEMEPVDTRVFVVNYARAEDLRNSIAPLVEGTVGGRVQVDVRSNALVITERPSRMSRVQDIIERLDRATDQVMIESKFVEVSQINDAALGVDWAFIDRGEVNQTVLGDSTGGASFGDVPVGTTIGSLVGGNTSGGLLAVFSQREYAATLRALETETKSRLISNPTVVVMNNREATFQVGEDFPVREFTFNQQTGRVESGSVEYRQTGIVLNVTPSVNAAGMISLDIKPKIDRVSDRTVQGPDGIEDQIFDVRRVETQVTIKDGYTIALGGLAEDAKSDIVSKVPLMGNLPLVGKLFSRTSVTDDKRNLIIFLTAKTLNPDGTTYRDIIDPRMLEDVDHVESETPGYRVPGSELELLRNAEAVREAARSQMRENKVQLKTNDSRSSGERPWRERVNLFNQ
ncbi:MAG: hypothetical protein EA353_11115 [Puniceicoccaceae bacterium]|nr:MAG: hypothetical protein EA353_11115 [Puniceicoccaceae bacterium]